MANVDQVSPDLAGRVGKQQCCLAPALSMLIASLLILLETARFDG